jgi:RNA polymerase sigma-70 factor (ECF subfamily)
MNDASLSPSPSGFPASLAAASIGTAQRARQPGTRLPRRSDGLTVRNLAATSEEVSRFACDLRLIAEAADQAAFARLFEYFAPRVKSYLRSSGLTPLAAEELAQETMLILWRKAGSFDPARAGVSTWIFTIARNLRIDSLRRERNAADLYPDDGAEAPPQADALLATARRGRKLRAMLGRLSPEQLAVIRLAFLQDKSHSQIAQALGIPLGTVKSRMRLAIERLRGLLGDM